MSTIVVMLVCVRTALSVLLNVWATVSATIRRINRYAR